MLLRIFVVLVGLASVAYAAPCKDAAGCTTACEGGDPASCIVATHPDLRPLTADWLTDTERTSTTCREYDSRCTRFAAHLWAGVGVKVQRKTAIEIWSRQCSQHTDHDACLAWAKAVQPAKKAYAIEMYRHLCGKHDRPLACQALSRIWTRVKSEAQGKSFSIELPALMVHFDLWSPGTWHVLWSQSMATPDVQVTVESGRLVCKAEQQPYTTAQSEKYAKEIAAHAAKYVRLPTNWAERICKSLRPF